MVTASRTIPASHTAVAVVVPSIAAVRPTITAVRSTVAITIPTRTIVIPTMVIIITSTIAAVVIVPTVAIIRPPVGATTSIAAIVGLVITIIVSITVVVVVIVVVVVGAAVTGSNYRRRTIDFEMLERTSNAFVNDASRKVEAAFFHGCSWNWRSSNREAKCKESDEESEYGRQLHDDDETTKRLGAVV